MLLALSVLFPFGVCPPHGDPAATVHSSYVWRISHFRSPTLKGRNQKLAFAASLVARVLTCEVGSTNQTHPHVNSICRTIGGNRQCTEFFWKWTWKATAADGPMGVFTAESSRGRSNRVFSVATLAFVSDCDTTKPDSDPLKVSLSYQLDLNKVCFC